MIKIASSVAKPDGEAIIVKISSPTRDVLSAVILIALVARAGVIVERKKNKAVSKPKAFTKDSLHEDRNYLCPSLDDLP